LHDDAYNNIIAIHVISTARIGCCPTARPKGDATMAQSLSTTLGVAEVVKYVNSTKTNTSVAQVRTPITTHRSYVM